MPDFLCENVPRRSKKTAAATANNGGRLSPTVELETPRIIARTGPVSTSNQNEGSENMSINQVRQVISIATNALADATVGKVDLEKIAGVIDILAMLDECLARCAEGGKQVV